MPAGWVGEFPNLIVTRTFSKVHGLAALRVGYGVSDPRVADLLNRVRQPFNVNSLAQAAALAALGDADHVAASVALNREGMAELRAGCDRLGLGYIPSVGNFLTVDLGRAAAPIYEALLREGCITRPVANYGLPNHLRVTIGLPTENAPLSCFPGTGVGDMMIRRLAVIGVGLIGGSLARALRAAGAVGEVVGCGRSAVNLQRALELGVVDRWSQDPAQAVQGADLVFVAVPLGTMRPSLHGDPRSAGAGRRGDRRGQCQGERGCGRPRCLRSGPAGAGPRSPHRRDRAQRGGSLLHRALRGSTRHPDPACPRPTPRPSIGSPPCGRPAGPEVTLMDVAHHDEVLAATSHLPHMLAFGLVDALARMRENDEIFRYAAGGFRDFTRIASSDPVMWRDICIANREPLGAMLERFGDEMKDLAETIRRGDAAHLLEIFARAKAARDRYVDTTAPGSENAPI